MTELAISLQNISKAYRLYPNKQARLKEALNPFGKKYHRLFMALKDINLDVPEGTILGIVGKNGSGKTTLLQVISKILTPSSGSVKVNGRVVALFALGAGFNEYYTGLQNIYFYGAVMGLSRAEMRDKEESIIDFAELGDFIHQPVKTYSSGMKARLAFAVATEIDPDILILDEVLSVGDELFRRKCFARMETFFQGGKTILFVSHSVPSINELCSQVILLDQGQMILNGPTKMVTSYYQKLLFSKKSDFEKVRSEILEVNGNKTFNNIKKSRIVCDTEKNKLTKRFKDSASSTKQNLVYSPEPYFLPEYKSKSTIEYRNYDVDITDFKIQSLSGQQVNVLIMNEEYIISHKVNFNIPAEKICFSYGIHNERGLDINNMRIGDLDCIASVQAGDCYLVQWRFKCLLMPGNYYVNFGVRSLKLDLKSGILNRIVDALVFKVMTDNEHRKAGGLIYLKQYPIIKKMA